MPRMWGKHANTRIANFATRNGFGIPHDRHPGPEGPVTRHYSLDPMPGPTMPRWDYSTEPMPGPVWPRPRRPGPPGPLEPLEPRRRGLGTGFSSSRPGDSLKGKSDPIPGETVELQKGVVDEGSEYLGAKKLGGEIILSLQDAGYPEFDQGIIFER